LRPDGLSFRVFAKQMTKPPDECGLSTKSPIDKSATTKSVQDDTNRAETPNSFALRLRLAFFGFHGVALWTGVNDTLAHFRETAIN